MKLLAIETSTDACSVALADGADERERHELAARRHGQLVLRFVDELLAEAGLRPGELDGLALGRGPGSFTGLRLGAGVVQGIAFGADLPVACVSSLAVLAQPLEATRVVCVQDARMGEVYLGGYVKDGAVLTEVIPERVASPVDLEALPGGGWLGVGSGFRVHTDVLVARLGPALEQVNPDHCYPRALDLLDLGRQVLEAGEGVSAVNALPVYLRDRVVGPPAGLT